MSGDCDCACRGNNNVTLTYELKCRQLNQRRRTLNSLKYFIFIQLHIRLEIFSGTVHITAESHVDHNLHSELFMHIWFPISVSSSSSLWIESKVPIQHLKKEYSFTKQKCTNFLNQILMKRNCLVDYI